MRLTILAAALSAVAVPASAATYNVSIDLDQPSGAGSSPYVFFDGQSGSVFLTAGDIINIDVRRADGRELILQPSVFSFLRLYATDVSNTFDTLATVGIDGLKANVDFVTDPNCAGVSAICAGARSLRSDWPLPRYSTYSASFKVLDGSATLTGGYRFATADGVPEPATWSLMILGFGAAAGAMRRSRRATALA